MGYGTPYQPKRRRKLDLLAAPEIAIPGYGNCFRCGSILLKDICITLGIQPADYGELYTSFA